MIFKGLMAVFFAMSALLVGNWQGLQELEPGPGEPDLVECWVNVDTNCGYYIFENNRAGGCLFDDGECAVVCEPGTPSTAFRINPNADDIPAVLPGFASIFLGGDAYELESPPQPKGRVACGQSATCLCDQMNPVGCGPENVENVWVEFYDQGSGDPCVDP